MKGSKTVLLNTDASEGLFKNTLLPLTTLVQYFPITLKNNLRKQRGFHCLSYMGIMTLEGNRNKAATWEDSLGEHQTSKGK